MAKVKQGWHRAVNVALALALVAALAIALLPQPAYADPGWWNSDWQYRKKLTFVQDAGQSGALTDFPVMVKITSSDTNFWSHVRDDGYDVRFLDSDDSTQCDFHFEQFDHVTDVMIAWVEVPSIAAYGTTDYIWLYYGNPSASADPQNESGTYDANFKMVQHLEETSGTHYDSTANNNDGTPQGGVSQNATGQISAADDFDGVDDAVISPDSLSLDITAAVTIEAWIYSTNFLNQYPGIVTKWDWSGTNPQRSYSLYLMDWTKPCVMVSSDGTYQDQLISATQLASDTWYYLTGVFTGSKYIIYINGAWNCEVDVTKAIHSGTAKLSIGSSMQDGSVASDETFKGTIDEVRISDIARSADWTKAQYLSMTDAFITFGSEETNQPPTVDAVALYQSDESTLIIAGGSMDPQVEYAVKVTVTDADTLNDVNEVKITIFYDSAGNDPVVPGTSNTQTCAIITWTKGSGWTIDPSASTTWVLVTASCKTPTMTATTGDWWAHFKPAKVATMSGAADDWDIYAKATDAAAGSGELYARDYEMNWYGEITVNTASVDWGTVALGSDFVDNEQTDISITYIANGTYNKQVKASSPWVAPPDQVTLNEAGNPGDGEFSLKAGNTLFFDDFSGDLSQWNIHIDTDVAITASYGNPAPSLEISGGITSSPFGFAAIGSDATYTGFQDGIIEADVYPATVALPEIIFRGDYSANSGYKGRWDCRSGNETPWVKPPYSGWGSFGAEVARFGIANQWQKAKLVIDGSTFKIYSNDDLKSTVTDTQYSGPGEIGLANHYGTYARFDNVRVRTYVTVLSADYTTFDSGAQMGEGGNTEGSNTLWLKLGPSGIPDATYNGTIYYRIAQ